MDIPRIKRRLNLIEGKRSQLLKIEPFLATEIATERRPEENALTRLKGLIVLHFCPSACATETIVVIGNPPHE